MDDRTRIEQICGRTVHCELCFKDGRLARALVDIAQPRWVGPRYFDVVPRILVVMLNPSSGKRYAKKSNPKYLRHLESYRSGKLNLKELFDHQKDDMPRWGRGRFWKFYMESLGLILGETAFANIAWCATDDNSYPNWMLDNCFQLHTENLIKALGPDLILLSGGNVQSFESSVTLAVPDALVRPIPHYAHWMKPWWEEEKLKPVRELIAELRRAGAPNPSLATDG